MTSSQINIAANNVTEGPLDIASINATMHGVHVNSGFNGATVDQLNGTALVTFAGLSHAAGIGDGITLSNGGNGDVKATIDLGFVSGNALAQVTQRRARTRSTYGSSRSAAFRRACSAGCRTSRSACRTCPPG